MAARPFRSVYNQNGLSFRHDTYSPAEGVSLWDNAPVLAAISDPASFHHFFDDFYSHDATATVGAWVLAKDTGGTSAVADGAGGVIDIVAANTDNYASILSSAGESWLFAASKPLWFEARVKLTEASTSKSNICVGLSTVATTSTMQDAGAGMIGTYDGAVFYKADLGVVWQFESSNDTDAVNTASAGAFTDGAYTRLGFVFDPADGTTGTITPWFDGVAGTAQSITLAGLLEMHAVCGVMTGTTTAETLTVDYVRVLQAR